MNLHKEDFILSWDTVSFIRNSYKRFVGSWEPSRRSFSLGSLSRTRSEKERDKSDLPVLNISFDFLSSVASDSSLIHLKWTTQQHEAGPLGSFVWLVSAVSHIANQKEIVLVPIFFEKNTPHSWRLITVGIAIVEQINGPSTVVYYPVSDNSQPWML